MKSLFALLALSAPVLAQDVRLVDPVAGPYLEINAAISAASSGDVILVRPGTYPALVIDSGGGPGKSLTLIAEEGLGSVSVVGASTIQDVPSGNEIAVRGFRFLVNGTFSGPALSVTNLFGHLWIEDSIIRMQVGQVSGVIGPALVLGNNKSGNGDAVFSRCTIKGLDSTASNQVFGVGGIAAQINGDRVSFYDCDITGGSGGPGRKGGIALDANWPTGIFISGGSVQGGDGGDGNDPNCTFGGGNGGKGLTIELGVQVDVCDSAVAGGAGGISAGCGSGSAGAATGGQGTLVNLAGFAHGIQSVSADPLSPNLPVFDNTDLKLEAQGIAGQNQFYTVMYSVLQDRVDLSNGTDLLGVLTLDDLGLGLPPMLPPVYQTTNGAGEVVLQLTNLVPNNSEAVVMYMQSFFGDQVTNPWPLSTLSAPTLVVVLDPNYLPN